MHRNASILFAMILALMLSSCGQKGPLKLPPETPKSTATTGAS